MLSRPRIVLSLCAVAALAACNSKSDKPTTTTSATNAPTSATAQPELPKKVGPVIFKDVGFSTPESVLHDEAKDTYLVSNINGKPLDVDNNGFISRLGPEGMVANLKWIEGGKNKVTLNAPKGLALAGDTLYVADIDTVRMFDRNTGAPTGEMKVPGATFLNDVAITKDGRILVSDSALKASAKGFDPTGTDAVWSTDKANKLNPVAKAKDLGSPNGLLPFGDKVWVVTFGSGEIYALDDKGKKLEPKKLPKGALDGIVLLPDGDLLVSSWEANAIFRGKPSGAFKMVIEDVKSPADIGYDAKRHRVLIPLFESDEVRAIEIK